MSNAEIAAQRGKDRQRWAQVEFENGRIHEAYDLYTEAESQFREAFDGGEHWVATRLFFTQSTVVRCLEELIEDTPSFLNTYRSCAGRLLHEWPLSRIKAEIHHDHVGEAFAFRAWRDSYLKGSHEFAAAAIATNEGNVETAKEILSGFIERMKNNGDEEADALCAIARSKIAMLPVFKERRKTPSARDSGVIVPGYLRAARASQLPPGSRSKQRERIAAFRATFLSEALKYRAFDLLRQMRDPQSVLQKAQCLFARATEYARRAESRGEFPPCHAAYLYYWHQVVTERAHLVAFMVRNDPADYDFAVEAWKEALTAMEHLCSERDESDFFPNNFLSLADLRLEGELLTAAKAFRDGAWTDCVSALERWRQGYPIEFSWNWRPVNVYIRLLGAKIVDAVVKRDAITVNSLGRELIDLSESEYAGETARSFAKDVVGLWAKAGNRLLFKTTIDWLAEHFPLDTWCDRINDFGNRDMFASLPKRLYNSLSIGIPTTPEQIEGAKRRVEGAVETLLGYLYDYYAQAFNLSGELPQHISSLIECCRALPVFGKGKRLSTLIGYLADGITKMREAYGTEDFNLSYVTARRSLLAIIPFVPVVVELRSTERRGRLPHVLEAFPDWAVQRDGRDVLYVDVDESRRASMTTGSYYIKPGMRRANMLLYVVSENNRRQFYPVRFTPRWDFWETEEATAQAAISEGVLLEHLRTAIDLSRMCKVSAQKPGVGAVIVKDRRIIQTAFRGEDGTDRHAEEIAIGKCTRDELRGAIMVTTLEPCTPHGRSPDKASCAMLLVMNQFSKVIIGIPDRDKRIQSEGDKLLTENNIAIAYFPSALRDEILEINKAFIAERTKGNFRNGVYPTL